MPTTVASIGSGTRTVVVSPTWRWPMSAESLSITISPACCGARPSISWYGLRDDSIQFSPNVGASWPPISSPSDPVTWATPSTTGWADATDGFVANSETRLSSIVPRADRSAVPISSSLRTIASVPELPSASNECVPAFIASPSTSVAARKATPITIAIAPPSSRRLRAQREEKSCLRMSVPQLLHAVQQASCSRLVDVVDDLAVGEEDDLVGAGGGGSVVRDHHDRLAELAH